MKVAVVFVAVVLFLEVAVVTPSHVPLVAPLRGERDEDVTTESSDSSSEDSWEGADKTFHWALGEFLASDAVKAILDKHGLTMADLDDILEEDSLEGESKDVFKMFIIIYLAGMDVEESLESAEESEDSWTASSSEESELEDKLSKIQSKILGDKHKFLNFNIVMKRRL